MGYDKGEVDKAGRAEFRQMIRCFNGTSNLAKETRECRREREGASPWNDGGGTNVPRSRDSRLTADEAWMPYAGSRAGDRDGWPVGMPKTHARSRDGGRVDDLRSSASWSQWSSGTRRRGIARGRRVRMREGRELQQGLSRRRVGIGEVPRAKRKVHDEGRFAPLHSDRGRDESDAII